MLAAAFLATTLTLTAQQTEIAGRVTEGATPLIGVTVAIVDGPDAGKRGATTSIAGRYELRGVTPGSHRLRFTMLGYDTAYASVSVAAGQRASADARLSSRAIRTEEVVVTASRRPQMIVDAPASISVVTQREIEERPSIGAVDHVRALPGVDVAETSLGQSSVVTRGFNSVFTGSLLVLTDGRVTSLPSVGINVFGLNPTASDDIERIELVRGPAAAMYGPNAHSGVMHVITRSALAGQGTAASFMLGHPNRLSASLRHAGTIGERFGYKISGSFLRGDEWEYHDPVEERNRAGYLRANPLVDSNAVLIGLRNGSATFGGGELRGEYLVGDGDIATMSFGYSQGTGLQLSNGGGAVQADGYGFYFGHARLSIDRFFAQAYYQSTDSRSSYLLRSGLPVVDFSSRLVAQVQQSFDLGENQDLIAGVDATMTMPKTDGTIHGRYEDVDDMQEIGAYLQSETRLLGELLAVVLSARADVHSELDALIYSPRAALLFKASTDHRFRLTYNRAYRPPGSLDFFQDFTVSDNIVSAFPDENAIALRLSGVPSGDEFRFRRDAGGRPFFHSSFGDRSLAIPVDSIATLWPVVLQLAGDSNLARLPAPSSSRVGVRMASLDFTSGKFVTVQDVRDAEALRPEYNVGYEIGYSGTIGRDLDFSIDAYYSEMLDALRGGTMTPNVFLDGEDLFAYYQPIIMQSLEQQGVPSAEADSVSRVQATQLAETIAGIPLGTVSPEGVSDPVTVVYSVYSKPGISAVYTGFDVAAAYRLTEMLSVATSYSFADHRVRNAPRNKGSISVRYRNDDHGVNAEMRYRAVDGFRHDEGVYVGYIPAYHLVDVLVGYQIQAIPGSRITLAIANALDHRHRQFVGAPLLGRTATLTIGYRF